MALTLWCGDCGQFLRNVRELEAGQCFPCMKIAKEVADAAAYFAAEVHTVCTGCGNEVQGHRAKTDGVCAVCLDKRNALRHRAKITYINDVDLLLVPCPTCGAVVTQWCGDGTGAKRKMSEAAHLARKELVLLDRIRQADSAQAS